MNINLKIDNCLFVLRIVWIFFKEYLYYSFFHHDYCLFIYEITFQLSNINILYVKLFQALSMNKNLINSEINDELVTFTDNVSWCVTDIDYITLNNIKNDYNLIFDNGFVPFKSGMISLVFLCNHSVTKERFIIKIKRKNIDENLNNAIEKIIFLFNILSFLPFIQKYNIKSFIKENIDVIQKQTDFNQEIKNMNKMRENCKNMSYIKIPYVIEKITTKYDNVICMENIEGLHLKKVDKKDYSIFAKLIIKFGLVTTLFHGVAHGDLHCGNILFIKKINLENDYEYKLGILDFGILFEIDEKFKNTLLSILSQFNRIDSLDIAKKIIDAGIIESFNKLDPLPKNIYNDITMIISNIVNQTLSTEKELFHQARIYDFLNNLNNYIQTNDLKKIGIKPSSNFLKLQLSLSMCHSLTLLLSEDNILVLLKEVIQSLFHLDLLEDEDDDI
jgi:predicted unusual protein kinase regulating ubiquinone biosynthesis (AarF/ABC1/UbiB family)